MLVLACLEITKKSKEKETHTLHVVQAMMSEGGTSRPVVVLVSLVFLLLVG
jgi:hypothetical protein